MDLGYGECDPARVDGAVEAGITADGEFVACVVMDQPSCAEADVYDISWPVDMEECEALSFDACDSTMWLDGECCALLEVVPAERDDEDDEVAEGRPFRVAGHARVADAVVKAWTTAARAEHASVASFARFTLQLLHLGAPADLVADAQQAGLDEVRHARLCFGVAVAWLVRTWPELRPELELQVESLEVAEAGPKGPEPLGAFGVLSAAGRQRVEQRVRRGVVLPVARSLLAESTGVSPGSPAPWRDDQYCSSR